MMNKRQSLFHSSFIIHHSSFGVFCFPRSGGASIITKCPYVRHLSTGKTRVPRRGVVRCLFSPPLRLPPTEEHHVYQATRRLPFIVSDYLLLILPPSSFLLSDCPGARSAPAGQSAGTDAR